MPGFKRYRKQKFTKTATPNKGCLGNNRLELLAFSV